ncbi:MAG TPA: hypothetical protein VNU68_16535 [Verrucomicrobiae bacterium]|jgi:hypothetical protein|nr:hypothetical protein [Verrucomicrobiae bacterium]
MKTDKVNIPTVEAIQAATTALNNLHATMTFLRPLTAPERRQYGRMGTQTVRQTAQRLEAALQHREALPPAFDLRQFERDTALLVALHDCLTASARIQTEVRDTLLALGTGTVQSGKELFAIIQLLATSANRLGRTVDSLKKRPRSARRVKAEPATEPLQTATVSATSSASPPSPPSAEKAA